VNEMKKKEIECQPSEHDFIYQLMSETFETGMGFSSKERRILYCRKCGKVKDLKV
jgi:hypothetical protein